MRRAAGRNSRGCRAIAISIQNINPINLIGNSVILYVLNMDSLHLEIEERISNAIRGFLLEIKVEKQMKKTMCKVVYSHHILIVVEELLSRIRIYIFILPKCIDNDCHLFDYVYHYFWQCVNIGISN